MIDSYEVLLEKVRENFDRMISDNPALFVTGANPEKLWDLYLNTIPQEENPVYLVNRVYDCNCCRHFFYLCGNVAAVKDGKLTTVWDVDMPDSVFKPVAEKLAEYVRSFPVTGRFYPTEPQLGVRESLRLLESGEAVRFHHFYVKVPAGKSVSIYEKDTLCADARTTKDVFQRTLEEITPDSIDIVLELIAQNSLYRGEEWKPVLEKVKKYQEQYRLLNTDTGKNLFLWEKSQEAGRVVGRLKNHSMGTLLTNISEGMELELAVRKWEQIMAPSNYRRPQAIITEKMLENARAKLEELGFMDSLPRRFATLNDITVNNILFSNKDAARRISGSSIVEDFFSAMKKEVKAQPKQFAKLEQIGIEDFVEKVLPSARDLEVYFENRHIPNLVSLIAPVNRSAPSLLKWENGFSWAYTGNIADSMIARRVKEAGGSIDGVLRFSIQWNDGESFNRNDEDAHCKEPNGFHIYYADKKDARTGGTLDVDIRYPTEGIPAVENITWPSVHKMDKGIYHFYVHTYEHRGGKGGFRAEVEADGEVHRYDYSQNTRKEGTVPVADVELNSSGRFTIKDILPADVSNTGKTKWGIKTNEFIPVSVVCYSPNWWDRETGVGNRHYFFMLKDCVNDESPNGFYNEQLNSQLEEHKRVLELLGSKAHVQDTPDQLSGLGFSNTLHNELVVRVTGATQRMLRIVF